MCEKILVLQILRKVNVSFYPFSYVLMTYTQDLMKSLNDRG